MHWHGFKPLVLLLMFALGGCERENLISVTDTDQQSARNYVEMLRSRQFDAILSNADPSLDAANVRTELDKMAAEFPAEEPRSVKLIRSRILDGKDPAGVQAQRIELTYEFLFPSTPVLANIALKRTANATTIVSLNAARIPENFNDFTFAGRSALQYTALLLATAIPLFTLWTLFACIRAPMERTTKWLWCLFIVVSVGRFSIDWVTGLWTFTPVSLLLFGTSIARSLGGYGPWVISVGLPAGAIAFHIWRARNPVDSGIPPVPAGK
jgi:hypothetical protein